jgi:N-acetylglutamate synthase-like GNAT family acetyltransferase
MDYKKENKSTEIDDFLSSSRFTIKYRIDYYITCRQNGKLIGVVPMSVNDGRHSCRFRYILPEYRHKGIGEGLATQSIQTAIDSGAEEVEFFSPKNRRGWKERRESEGFVCKSVSSVMNRFRAKVSDLGGFNVKI